MQIFLSYASEDRSLAEEIQLALVGAGHKVFFDKTSLPAGGDYHSRIQSAVHESEMFIFLISQNSVTQGSYALTELKFARSKWPHPENRVLPVRLHQTAWESMPAYLKSVTVLEAEGNIPAEVVAAIGKLTREGRGARTVLGSRGENAIRLAIALIGLAGAIGAALITNWQNIFEAPANMVGPAADRSEAPIIKEDCTETTEYDYSTVPPTSKVVRRCLPKPMGE